ncbi:MAG: prenyltransferase/squalene oxidase repeat-containing protein [Thermoleophilaceae bacterium]
MSWQLDVLLVLAAMLIGGFAWYERSRPPSQIVALVAALAAISVAGRVAFSPIPNVVPTTDITLIAGFALGAAPGFAVGALSGLVSNFWLGQGPWTPWQMAGWGMTGLFGAWLAALSGRRLGRVWLAVVCALAGFAYGALLDFSLMVTYGGEQSLDRFLAISARGVPFNIAHAGGNAALALVAGPAMVRMLLRYRRRFEYAWRRSAPAATARAGGAATAACLVAALLLAAPALLPGDRAQASGAGSGPAVAWLRGAENDDGGFGFARGEESSPAMTGWAVLGLEAAGVNPLDVDHGDATPISYLAGTVGEISTTGDIERTILVLRGAGLDPRQFQGRDLVARLLARRGGDGSWGGQVNPTAFGILALAAAGATSGNSRSAGWLRTHQNQDGGWGFAPGSASDPDSTGAVLQALAGGSRAAMRGGVSYLRRVQRPGGGFALSGGPANAQSTAWAVQGLAAAGVSPSSVRSGGRSPLDYLSGVRAADGHYRYSTSSDQTPVWVTGQALMAANGAAFPLSPVPRQVSTPRAVVPDRAGGGAPAQGSGGKAEKTHGQRDPGGTSGAQPSEQPTSQPLAPAASSGDDGGGGGILGWLIAIAAAGALAAAAWGGWVLYRRRLPDRPAGPGH